jgi:histidinol-phosphate/aromatic aminotransferase/cobyric acid decarboxylase-like protein
LGKNFGLHGVRLGYAVTNPEMAERLRVAMPRWNVNALGELLIHMLADHMDEYEQSRRRVVRDRIRLSEALHEYPQLHIFPSRANFVYARIDKSVDGITLRNHLLTEHGLFVRECGNKIGSDSQHFRIAARPQEEMDLLVRALGSALPELSPVPATRESQRIGLAPRISNSSPTKVVKNIHAPHSMSSEGLLTATDSSVYHTV